MRVSTGRKVPHILISAIAFFCFSLEAWAQIDQGAIVGTVQDKSGAVVSGAKVTLTNEGTGLVLTTTTAGDGNYVFNPIKIGTYSVTAEKTGFTKATQVHITVDIGAQVKADFTLVPGTVTETVEVTAALPLLQTQTSSVGQTVTSTQATDLPLNGRNYTFLAQISAGVTTNGSRVAGTGGFTANGLQWSHNSYILDGIDNNNDTVDFLNGAAYVALTPPDAIQEVKVQTSDFNAEYGRAGSAVLNATTKSGSNKFHGDVWEFLRNDAFDANSFFNNRNGVKKPELRQNQFGFTFGGPVEIPRVYNGHNKTFFFMDYQGTIIRQGAVRNPTVPTAQMRNSGFTNLQELIFNQSGTRTDALGRTFPQGSILDSATTRPVTAGQVDPVTGLVAAATGFVRDPFFSGQSVAGITNFTTAANEALMNILPAGRLDPNAIKLLSAYPGPNVAPAAFNNFGLFNNFLAVRPQPDNTHQFDVRIDQNFSSKDQIFGRLSHANHSRNILNNFTGPIDDSSFGQGAFSDLSWNVALSYTHMFSPAMINEARIGYSRLRDNAQPAVAGVQGIPAQFGIQGAPQGAGGGLPLVVISGLNQVGPGEFASPNTRVSNTVQFTENLTKIYRSHTFKGGFENQLIRFAFDNPRDPRGRMDFRGNYTGIPPCSARRDCSGVGSGIADLLLTPTTATVPNGVDYEGGPGFVIADSNVAPDSIRHYYGAYFQDDWKATRRLTLNLGLRWEFFGQLRDRLGEAIFVPGAPFGGPAYIISSSSKNIPLASSFTSLLTKDGIALEYSGISGLMPTPTHDFAPRVGLAYQLTSKFVMRASYGIFYAGFENLGGSPDPGTNYPFAVEPTLNDSTSGTQTLKSQNASAFPSGTNFASLENALTLVTPNPTSPAYNPQGSGFQAFAIPWHTGNTQEWNLFGQYALTPNDSIQAGYIGNHSVHLINGWRTNSISEILPPGTNRTAFRPFPDFGENQNFVVPNGDGYYHAFQITYERRITHGLQVLANFTRSLCMTDIRNILNDNTPSGGGLQRAPYLPGFGLKGDYGYCADDRPRVLHVSSIWEVPFGRGKRFGREVNRVVNQIFGRWILNDIWTLQDGAPGTVGCPVGTTSGFGCVANLTGQPLYLHQGNHGIDHFLNPAAFAQPPAATTIGQTDYSPLGGPTTQFHGPGFDDLDFSLFKQFRFTENESRYFELRGEFFNVFNHPNFGNPSSLDFTQNPNSSSYNFAHITGTVGNPRQTQISLKFYW
jgi:Carboxypeptidase regulatory-like domain/TonB dependent receptor/TonB-dependent Receptor Plug Domain